MRHWYSPHDKTEVDECPGCAGMWLDARELVAIRSRFSSHAERQNAAQEYLQRLLGPELEKAQVEGAAYKQRTERLYKFLRFICPSYYFGSE